MKARLSGRTALTSLHNNHPGRRMTMITAPLFCHNSEACIKVKEK